MTYYYAGGKKIELETDDDHIAIDRAAAPASLIEELIGGTKAARELPGGVVVAPRASISASELAALRAAGALRPVFRRDRAMLVALSEVRVEVDTVHQHDAVKTFLSTSKYDVIVAEESDSQFVLTPVSGSPVDALNAANAIYEQAHPAASSVRFVQYVPRPKLKP